MSALIQGYNFNSKMKELFYRYSVIPHLNTNNVNLPDSLLGVIKDGVCKFKGGYIFRSNLQSAHNIEINDVNDLTGFECFVNEISIDNYLEEGYNFTELFKTTIGFMDLVEKLLQNYVTTFILFGSFQEDEFLTSNVRFYMLRENEIYLIDDIDKYKNSGLIVKKIN